MTTNDTAPRCPSCDGALTLVERSGFVGYICANCNPELMPISRVLSPARVPCPACGGEGIVPPLTVIIGIGTMNERRETREFDAPCTLCRGRGDVPPALAAAWTADGDSVRSGGEG